MASRREVIQAGLGAVATSSLPGFAVIAADRSETGAVYRAVYDERFPEALAFAARARRRGWPTRAIRGDVTDLWFNEIALRWRKGPTTLCGVTASAALFCLEMLARDAGMRVAERVESREHELASWVIAPRLQKAAGA